MMNNAPDWLQSRQYETPDWMKKLLLFIGWFARELARQEIAPLLRRIEELEKRGIEYRGIYQRSCEYRRGSMITHDGNLWCCITDAEVNESPGSHPSKWQLAVKAGRDGRDVPRQPTHGGARPETTMRRRT
jgi:hypothetical protein